MNFKLQLLKTISIYPIFHVSLLKSAPDNASLIRIMDAEEYENQDYHIKKVLN